MKRERLTVPQAARETGVLVSYLYALLASGRLKGEKVGGQWQLDRREFEGWRQQHKFYKKREVVRSKQI